jgi:multiple sugar transport system ATP-binding protein
MTRLVLKDVVKKYGDIQVIHGIDMDIKSGEFCVFVGPSGCGKSTLLRMISGLEDISGGQVQIDDDVVNHIPAAQRGLAMVFQSYALYPHMSVKKNLSFGLENLNMARDEIDQRVDQAAQMLQIHDYLGRRPGQLSGGQRQRVAIGRAVVREPKIFLFDEPLSNLDAELRVTMRREIAQLHRRLGNTMVYVTHDQVEAMTMADKIAVLRAGRLEQFGTPLDLFNRPVNRFVAGFIGSPAMNFADGEITQGGVVLGDGTHIAIEKPRSGLSHGDKVTLGFRPREIIIQDDGPITLTIQEVEQLGSESYIFVSLPSGENITVHQAGQTHFSVGDVVKARVNDDGLYLFKQETGEACY